MSRGHPARGPRGAPLATRCAPTGSRARYRKRIVFLIFHSRFAPLISKPPRVGDRKRSASRVPETHLGSEDLLDAGGRTKRGDAVAAEAGHSEHRGAAEGRDDHLGAAVAVALLPGGLGRGRGRGAVLGVIPEGGDEDARAIVALHRRCSQITVRRCRN